MFDCLTLLVGRHEEHLTCRKLEWWGTGMQTVSGIEM